MLSGVIAKSKGNNLTLRRWCVPVACSMHIDAFGWQGHKLSKLFNEEVRILYVWSVSARTKLIFLCAACSGSTRWAKRRCYTRCDSTLSPPFRPSVRVCLLFCTSLPFIAGFCLDTLEYKNLTLFCWDVGTGNSIRPLWRHYCAIFGLFLCVFMVCVCQMTKCGR